jgi:hypothetical protein
MHLFEIVPEAARAILSDYFREKVGGRALIQRINIILAISLVI